MLQWDLFETLKDSVPEVNNFLRYLECFLFGWVKRKRIEKQSVLERFF